MLRSVFGPAARSAGLLLLAVSLLSSCSKKVDPVGPSSRATDGKVLLMGTQNTASTSYVFLDPGTPDDLTDDKLSLASDVSFTGDTTNAVLQLLDLSNARTFRPFRRNGAGEFQQLFDFDIQAYDRDLRSHIDRFFLSDAGQVGVSEYRCAGVIQDVAASTSPTSAAVKPWGRVEERLAIEVGRVQRDSVMTLSFTPDPRAVAYFVEIVDFGKVALNRGAALLASLPLPVALPHQLSSFGVLLPGEELVRIPMAPVPFTRGFFPRAFVVRVTAIDASNHVVSRSQADYSKRTVGRTDKSENINLFDPLGGYVVLLDPYGAGAPYPAVENFRVAQMIERNSRIVAGPATPFESFQPELDQFARQQEAAGYEPPALRGMRTTIPAVLFEQQEQKEPKH